jgi:hypothetical protein
MRFPPVASDLDESRRKRIACSLSVVRFMLEQLDRCESH